MVILYLINKKQRINKMTDLNEKMEEALTGIKEQLEEARGDLDYINQRME